MRASKWSTPPVVVLGDITVDIFAQIEALPKPGDDCLSPGLELHCGGVAANAALALAKWGVPVRLLGCTGRDCFARIALDFLRRAGIDVSGVQQTERALTGLMFIVVSPGGQRTIFGSRGANAVLQATAADAGYLNEAGAAHLVGYNYLTASVAAAADRLVEGARRRGAQVSLDVGMEPSRKVWQKVLQVVRKVDILFVSQAEATALTGKNNEGRALAALRACGPREVVLKLGEEGCLLLEGAAVHKVPPFAVRVADTTGAGDAFAAAFLRARLSGWPPTEAALVANAAGAAAASVIGAGERVPSPGQIGRLVRASRLAKRWEPLRLRVLERLKQEFRPEESGNRRGG
jgi:ribokinase